MYMQLKQLTQNVWALQTVREIWRESGTFADVLPLFGIDLEA